MFLNPLWIAAWLAIAPQPSKVQPNFMPYDDLSVDLQRILDHSQIAVRGKAPTHSGAALYAALAARQPVALANFLNQAAVLADRQLTDGRCALSCVQAVERFGRDRVFLLVDPRLVDQIRAMSVENLGEKALYSGPEDSSLMHGRFAVSFRERRPYTSQQLSFSPADNFCRLEVDIDEECPSAGDANALFLHLGRVGLNRLGEALPWDPFGTQTDPYAIYGRLTKKPTAFGGRGLAPGYHLD